MKAVKYLLYFVSGLAGLAVLALIAAVLIVDGGFVKSRLEKMMKDKNRTLVIEGTPSVRLFPVAGISLGKTTLSESGGAGQFVAVEKLEAGVRVMPLLSGEIAVESLKVSGLSLNVLRDKGGRMNFADLAEGGKQDDAKPDHGTARGEAPRVKIAELAIEGARIHYADAASGQDIAISDLTLKSARLDGDTPGPVSFSVRVAGRKPDLDIKAEAGGGLRFNLARQEYAIDGFSFKANGRIERDTLAAEFSAPKLEITPARAGGSTIEGRVQLRGPARNANLQLRIAALEGSASALSMPSLALEFDAAAEGRSVKGKLTTSLKADLAKRIYELPKLVASLTLASPEIPQKSVTLPIEATLKADGGRQSASGTFSTRFDESNIQAKFSANRFVPLDANFDVVIDRLNLDRYLPAGGSGSSGAADPKVDLSALKGRTVSGKLAIGSLTVKRVKLEALKVEMKLAGGKLEVAPHTANLYGGTVAGQLSADANGNRVAVKETLQNVALGALLRDAVQKDIVDGKANLTLDVQTAGGTVSALKMALAGSLKLEMKDGAIKGVNLADSVRNARAALGSKQAKADPNQKTDFSDLSASFKIDKGVARNDDLKAASPFVRLAGAGSIDIGGNTLDYLAKASLVATSKGQGGREAKDVAGITIPVQLSGPLDSPNWKIDYSALLGSAAGSLGELGKQGAGGVKDAAGGVKDAVRGLFRR